MSRHQFDDAEFEVVGERPFYTPSMTEPRFHLNDENIYVDKGRGPFKIASVEITSTPIKYKLSRADDTLVDNGALFEETKLAQQD